MLESEIKKLTAAIEALTAAIGNATVEVEATTPAPFVEIVIKSETVNMDDLTRKCLALSRCGRRDEIKAQLALYNVGRVTELGGDNLTTFAAWVEKEVSKHAI